MVTDQDLNNAQLWWMQFRSVERIHATLTKTSNSLWQNVSDACKSSRKNHRRYFPNTDFVIFLRSCFPRLCLVPALLFLFCAGDWVLLVSKHIRVNIARMEYVVMMESRTISINITSFLLHHQRKRDRNLVLMSLMLMWGKLTLHC